MADSTSENRSQVRFSAAEIARRQESIVGQPPRIRPLSTEQLSAADVEIAARIGAAAGSTRSVKSPADVPEILATLLCHPKLTESIMNFATLLYVEGALSPRDRELLALRTVWLCRTPFEWGEHVGISKRAGLTSEDLERITQGSSAPGWNEDERAILRAAEELHADAMISDEVWAALARRLSDQQLFELTIVVGHYTTAAYFENALRLRLRPGNLGLLGR